MPRFFVPKEKIEGQKGMIVGAELDHMRRVLRLRPGDHVALFDNEGWEYEGVVQSYSERAGEVKILRSYRSERESPLEVILAQALGKGEKVDWVVEKATELGVRTIIPFLSSYTIPKLDRSKIEHRRARWEKIALSAAKQSGRARIPEILEPCDFEDLAAKAWPCDLKLLCWEGESPGGFHEVSEGKGRVRSILLVIGPEGGFTGEEVARALRHGFRSVRLGRRILRTETAAVVALSIAQFLWGDIG